MNFKFREKIPVKMPHCLGNGHLDMHQTKKMHDCLTAVHFLDGQEINDRLQELEPVLVLGRHWVLALVA